MSRSDWETAVEKSYLTTSPACGASPSESKHPFYLANYGQFFPQDLDAPILDVGIGSGDLLLLWEKLGYRNVSGVDINTEPVELCKKRFAAYCISQVSATPDFLRINPHLFSLITMLDVLEHLRKGDMFDILIAAREALHERGCLVVQTINAANPFQIAGRYCDITHQQSFTELSLRQIFKLAGFRSVEIGPVETILSVTLKRRVKRFLRSAYHRVCQAAYRLDDGNRFEVMTALIRVVGRAD